VEIGILVGLNTSCVHQPFRCFAGLLLGVSIFLAAIVPGSSFGQAVGDDGSPQPPDLRAFHNSQLQSSVEQVVREQGLWEHVESRNLAFGLVDITKIDAPRYAALNPDHMMYAASLPKIAILLGAFVQIAEGELTLDEGLNDEMVRMIRYSDNASATSVLAKVGRQDLIDILTSENLRLYDRDQNGGLWVGKDYARDNAYERDPLHNLSHGATVYQVLRFFYLLEKGELVDQRYRDAMKEILSEPGISHKFVAGLEDRSDIKLYRKSGTWRDYHADAALVEAGKFRYIIAGLVRHPDGGKWLARLANATHDLAVEKSAQGEESN